MGVAREWLLKVNYAAGYWATFPPAFVRRISKKRFICKAAARQKNRKEGIEWKAKVWLLM